ncbi:MAG: HAMP domain-containing histidine kinase [Chitinophagaceae bacterium]|nr:HAMP domain-containing histidine kinase [Chitinophagaceae bacterium]
MKPIYRNNFFWKLGLLIAAVVLFALSYVFYTIYTDNTSLAAEKRYAEKYVHDKEEDFDELLEDSSLVLKLLQDTETEAEFRSVTGRNYGIFLYTVSNAGTLAMNFWNSQLILPPPETYALGDFGMFMDLANGHYYVIKRSAHYGTHTVVAYAMIPVQSDFFLDTDYLPKHFFFSQTADQRVVLSKTETPFPVRSISGNVIFYLDKKTTGAIPYNSQLTLILRLGGIIFLLLFIHSIAESLARRKKIWQSIAFLGISLLAIRMVTYMFPGILNLRQFELFDPTVYGSNLIQRSLGDLLFNSIFFCWFVLFAWGKVQRTPEPGHRFPPWVRWVAGIISLCLLIYSTFVLSSVIRSMVADSKISFDVTDFSSLKFYTVVGFIVLACISLSYYYFTQLLFRVIFPLFKNNTWPIYFAIGFAGLVYLTVRSGDPTVLFYIPVLAWLLLYTWLVNRKGLILYNIRINIAGIMFWIFVFSVSISAIMLSENKQAEWKKRQFFAEKLAVQMDPSSERLMSIAIQYLDNDFLSTNFRRFNDSAAGKLLRDSIITGNYRGYLNKYDTRLYIFDSMGQPMNNEDPMTYATLNTIVTVQSKTTGTPDLFYFETAFDNFTYITERIVVDTSGNKMGSFFIISNPKRYSSDALFPVLFKQYKKNDPENSPIYSYAVYNKKQLISRSDKYPFPTKLADAQLPRDEFKRVNRKEYDELWYKASNEKVVIMARKRDTIIESITLFSYIFCSFLFLITLVQLVSFIIKTGYNWGGIRKLMQLNIRTQVHSTIIFISIFSFFIIAIATISFFVSRHNRTNSDKLSRTMKIMVKEMEKKIGDHKTFDDVVMLYDSVSSYRLQQLADEVSDIHGVDVNVYDLNGDLQVSSESNVYDKGVLSKKIDPTAFFHLNRMNLVEWVQEEYIANFAYLSIYAPVMDDGNVYAYLSIPYFTSEQELNMEISNFIVTVINLNAFIFLIAGLIALFITNRITRSFSLISDKMKEVNLAKVNEEIVWGRDDEIGELVKEYNKMVNKLEQSAAALAKNEREGAWREMARQVAHEIKNPLTPMKLSIQYLQKSINSNLPNVKELSGTVANTLIEQIDHLSKIAADFSQFANIGITNVEDFDLHDVLRSLKELYQPNDHVDFIWHPVDQPIMVEADKTQMNRLFTNLFANAIEACRNSCVIEVTEKLLEGYVRISIADNGEGIASEMQSRIFTPNFTTKSSGTGLGLAMVKGIVEQAKGRIWFETEQGRGTTFHVEIPLAV